VVDFEITDKEPRILRCDDGGCRPATNSEIELWDEIARLQEEVETLTTERDAARKAAFLGCEANDGGPHSIIKQGSYRFCGNCGYTIKTPTLHERARTAEAERDRLREALTKLCDWIEHEVGAELPFDARAALQKEPQP